MAATEMVMDEIAATLGLDPIEFRRRNALRSGMKNTQGAIPAGAMRAHEVLGKARAHPLWGGRAARKAEYEARHPGKRYGVGFGCVQKDFGTGAECCFAKLEVSRRGPDRASPHRRRDRAPACPPRRRWWARAGWAGRPTGAPR